MSFLLIPAVDLKNGQCVRLRQGEYDDVTVFSDNPVEVAKDWIAKGAKRIHVVDLDGAAAGYPKNKLLIQEISKSVGDDIPIQVGGGLRDLDTIEKTLDMGAAFVVIGTAAVKNPGLLKDACAAFLGHIIVSIDAKDGKVATDGWSKLSGHEVVDLAKKYEDDGVEAILYTDIGRDGMLSGVNLDATLNLAQSITIPVIASGGVADMSDIKSLCKIEQEGVMGTILGRSIYEGKIDFELAQKYVEGVVD
jgi:phosphoribosylformimino-5-aminoimidazole carboxamide ribotide isomerase